MRQSNTAQKLYDWSGRFKAWDNRRREFVWPKTPIGWFAKILNEWIYYHFDIIPF